MPADRVFNATIFPGPLDRLVMKPFFPFQMYSYNIYTKGNGKILYRTNNTLILPIGKFNIILLSISNPIQCLDSIEILPSSQQTLI